MKKILFSITLLLVVYLLTHRTPEEVKISGYTLINNSDSNEYLGVSLQLDSFYNPFLSRAENKDIVKNFPQKDIKILAEYEPIIDKTGTIIKQFKEIRYSYWSKYDVTVYSKINLVYFATNLHVSKDNNVVTFDIPKPIHNRNQKYVLKGIYLHLPYFQSHRENRSFDDIDKVNMQDSLALFTVLRENTAMNMHKNTRLTPYHREEIWRLYTKEKVTVTALAQKFNVSRPTIYKTLKLSRHKLFRPQLSTNERYKTIKYGIKRLVKIEKAIEDRLKRQAKRYNKNYPGEMFHVDTKRLPLLKGETKLSRREYLFVGIDDYSRELYAGIYDDKSQFSAAMFLQNDVLAQVPYTIECVYSDNGREYQGTAEHAFVKLCLQNHINQKFTKPACPQTNGKAERVIRTLMEMWHERETFINSSDRQAKLRRFINFYNTVKPHKGLNGATPYEILEFYFNQKV